jgi:hypothetical protein
LASPAEARLPALRPSAVCVDEEAQAPRVGLIRIEIGVVGQCRLCRDHLAHVEIADVVLGRQRHGLGLEQLVAVTSSLVEDHLGELDMVGGRAVALAAAHVEFQVLLELERGRRQRSIRPSRVHADQPFALRI